MTRKLISLEAVRGIASLIVLVHHVILGFAPELKTDYPAGFQHTPLNWMINGTAAVALFFVLSGFVLTRRFYEMDRQTALLLWATVKRLPRLILPAGLSVMLGYLIMANGLHHNAEAAILSDSVWLNHFALVDGRHDYVPPIREVFLQSFQMFFNKDRTFFNSNLWTMRGEYLGSLMCFAYLLVYPFMRHWRLGLLAINLALLWLSPLAGEFATPFALGCLLAQYLPRGEIKMPLWAGLLVLALALILCSSDKPVPMALGGFFVLLAVLCCQGLSAPLSGKIGSTLGAISFPIYLVHLLVIVTVSSGLYVQLQPAGLGRYTLLAIEIAVTLGVSLVIAEPFRWIDRWWVPALNRLVTRLETARQAYFRASMAGKI
ncbi:MAG: acyltransferase [Rhodobacteraceae bacterium]|nr:acyltransferase [Paracoccaceae bacterium]